LTGVAGNVRYPGLWIDHQLDEVVAPQPETDNYLTMRVTDEAITNHGFYPNKKVSGCSGHLFVRMNLLYLVRFTLSP
jgi:hypothetical protein